MSQYPEAPDAWITHHPIEDEPEGGYCPKCECIAEDCECDNEEEPDDDYYEKCERYQAARRAAAIKFRDRLPADYQRDQIAEEREEIRQENWNTDEI